MLHDDIDCLVSLGLSARAAGAALANLGSLAAIGGATAPELEAAGVPAKSAAKLAAAFALGRRSVTAPQTRPLIGTADDVHAALRGLAGELSVEVLWVLPLTARNELIGRAPLEVARGTVCGVEVHPREVFRAAIRCAAAGIVVAHNHPSGDPTPSCEDIQVTRRLRDVGATLGIPVIDHVVVTAYEYRSIHEWTAGRYE